MAKFAAIAAVCLAAIFAVAAGQAGETEQQRLKDVRCLREVQESPLDACRQVLRRQLTSRTGPYGPAPFPWSAGMRMQCCQQLQDVSRECRCAAIRRMVRNYEQTMPPLEQEGGGGGYYGGSGESTGQEYYGQQGSPCQKQQGGYSSAGCGETGWRRGQQGGGGYYGGARQQQGAQAGCGGCGSCGQRGEEYGRRGQQPITRVGLGKVRQYAARLPMMCSIEPQECSVFSGAGGSEYY